MNQLSIWIFLICQIALNNSLLGQQGYLSFILKEQEANVNIDDIIFKNDNLYVRGNILIDSIGRFGLFVAQLDTMGNTKKFNFEYEPGVSMITNTPTRFQISENNELILPNYYFATNTLALSVWDSSGTSLISKGFPKFERSIFPHEAFKIGDAYYLFGIIQRSNYLDDDFKMKIDTNGNEVWFKYLGVFGHNERLGAVSKNPDNTFTVSTSRFTDDYFQPDKIEGWRRPIIFCIDTTGTVRWEWAGEYNDPRTHGGGPFHHLPNGDWVIISDDLIEVPLAPHTGEVWSAPTITKLDSNFNLIWKDTLIDFAFYRNKIVDMEYDSLRDELILVGNRYLEYEEVESTVWVLKMKTSGEILWEITDTLSYNKKETHYTAGVALSPSGSIYLSGYYRSEIPQLHTRGWLMKVSPDGCVDTFCNLTSLAPDLNEEKHPITVYPNPASNTINVKVAEDLINGELHIITFKGGCFSKLKLKHLILK